MSATVHVWTIPVDESPETVPSLLELLSGEERVRAARLRTTELRVRFVVAHGALRSILSGYLGVKPAALTFDSTEAGKPFLPGAPVSFNLSHSDGLAICAVTMGGQVGVDIERLRRIDDADAIVKRYFAPGELRQYAAVRLPERTAAFFSTWTRKEAFVKAVGSGIQRGLSSFEVEVSPHAVCPRLALDAGEPQGTWSLRSFAPRPQYVAAVALDRDIEALEFFDWSADALATDAAHRFAIR
jgi:4'-phosphopantetheinyl transferase